MTARSLPRFVTTVQKSGLKADEKRIEKQLKTGYAVVSLKDRESHYRADFIVQRERIERRAGSMFGIPVYYQSPEALVLAKLRMIKATVSNERSRNDRDDIEAILANTKVDVRKIRARSRKEGTLETFNSIRG